MGTVFTSLPEMQRAWSRSAPVRISVWANSVRTAGSCKFSIDAPLPVGAAAFSLGSHVWKVTDRPTCLTLESVPGTVFCQLVRADAMASAPGSSIADMATRTQARPDDL